MQIDRVQGWRNVSAFSSLLLFLCRCYFALPAGQSCKNTEDNKYALSLSLYSRRQMVSTEVMSEASLLFLERADVRDPSVQTFQASLFRIIIYVFTIKHIQLQRKTLIFPRCELL